MRISALVPAGLVAVLLLLPFWLVRPVPAAAQAVRGEVVEEHTGAPLPGAFIVLVDEAGARHQGVLSDSAGRFLVRAPRPGRYRLVAELIGYAGTESPPLDLVAGPAREYRLEVPVQAVDLSGISVSARSRCEARPGSGAETAALWEEARKALEVQSWGEGQKVLRMRTLQYTRQLSPNAHSVREASQRSRVGYYSSSPYVSRPAEELEREGYIRQVDGGYEYYGPDAAVLLSDAFLASHCFRVVEGPAEEPGLVGLAFEPVRGRDRPDVEGVLWVDRGTAELRRLDFTYTSLPFRGVETDHAGGRVEYERLANGVWIIKRWRLRFPLVAEKQQPAWRSAMPTLEVVALDETGAEVQSVTDASGVVLAEASGGTLYGVVWDSIHDEPLVEAAITLADDTTVTGADGAFRFVGVPAGTYPVSFNHPALELLGIEVEPRLATVTGGTATRLPLATPGPEALAAAICGSDGEALIYGAVTDESARWPVPDALVRLEAGSEVRTVTADSAGVYRACIPSSTVRVAGFRPGAARGALASGSGAPGGPELAVPGGAVRRLDVAVAAGEARVTAAWTNRIRGRVLAREGRAPVAGATVTLTDAGGEPLTSALTDETGAFQVAHPGAGYEFRLRAEHLGYAPSEGVVAFTEEDELGVELLMDPDPVELEPIVVVERRRGFLADVGYYLRKERGLGRFVEREAIERYRPSRLSDLFRRVPGVTVVGHGRDMDLEMVGMKGPAGFAGNPYEAGTGTGGLKCAPAIYLDGTLVRPGGHPNPTDPVLNDIIDPEQIEAVEVYRRISEVPAVYAGKTAGCGVVAVWTRRPT